MELHWQEAEEGPLGGHVNLGDAYCFVASERNTKLVLNIALRKRDQGTPNVFIEGLAQAVAPR